MMTPFINRRDELDFLERKCKSDEAELLVFYGRRRIGKTEVLLNFAKDKRYMYFLGRLESKPDTIKRFNARLMDFFKDLELARRPLENWDEIFDYLGRNAEKRTIVIIDEFPFIVEKFPEIISVLQDKWDNALKKTKIMLVLSGSFISMMEKYALDYESPLYGRRTGQWMIGKMGIEHLKRFFPKFSAEEVFLLYSCLDTIPGYLVKFSPEMGVLENIGKRMLAKGEFLYDEPEILLREELRDPSNYMSILSSITGGTTTFNDIHLKSRLDKSLLSKYLYVLEKLEMVGKAVPVTETYKTKLKAKGAVYFMKDNFFDFWFRFVYLNKQQLEEGEVELVLNMIKTDLPTYLGRKFESFAMELLPKLDVMTFTRIGRWWHKGEEIDIVALNDQTKDILFGECKWQDNVDAGRILHDLKEKAKFVQWNNDDRKEHYAIFAKSFKKRIKEPDVMLFDLNDLERAVLK